MGIPGLGEECLDSKPGMIQAGYLFVKKIFGHLRVGGDQVLLP